MNKKTIPAVLLLAALLLSGCGPKGAEPAAQPPQPVTMSPIDSVPAASGTGEQPATTEAPASDAETGSSPAETETPPPETETDPAPDKTAEQLALLRDWLERPCSMDVEMGYSYYPFYGFDYSVLQVTGADESFRFTTVYAAYPGEDWSPEDPDSPYRDVETIDWYYCYEGDTYCCYRPDGERALVTTAVRRQMAEDRSEFCGSIAVLPEGIEGFTDRGPDITGVRVFEWRIPYAALEASGSMPWQMVGRAVRWTGDRTTLEPVEDLEAAAPALSVWLETEPETLRPIRVLFDYGAFKPYLFGDGPLSAESAMDVDVLYYTIVYDYELPAAVDRDAVLEPGFLD